MQYSQEHLKTMVYAEFGEQTECIMGNWKIGNYKRFQRLPRGLSFLRKNLALWGGGGGEMGLEKLCVPVEKFRLYTWKQQDLEVVILL